MLVVLTSNLSSVHAAAQASSIPFRIKVTNTGKRDGDEVVLAFVRRDNTSMGPLKQLFAFQRVHLKIGKLAAQAHDAQDMH